MQTMNFLFVSFRTWILWPPTRGLLYWNLFTYLVPHPLSPWPLRHCLCRPLSHQSLSPWPCSWLHPGDKTALGLTKQKQIDGTSPGIKCQEIKQHSVLADHFTLLPELGMACGLPWHTCNTVIHMMLLVHGFQWGLGFHCYHPQKQSGPNWKSG